MKKPNVKDSIKLRKSILEAGNQASLRIIESARLVAFADCDGERLAALQALENAVYSEMDLATVAEELTKMYSKVELESAVEDANQAIAKRAKAA